MNTTPHFSSATDEWATDPATFKRLHRRFRFDLDVCATPTNAKCRRFYTREVDGLGQPWQGRIWMNPPYGRELPRWMARAEQAAREGALVVCLIPARTDTQWWHRHVMRAHEVIFIEGREQFGGQESPAPFPSAVVVFKPGAAPARGPRFRAMKSRGR